MERKKVIYVTAAVNGLLLLSLFIVSLSTKAELMTEAVAEREVTSPAFVEIPEPTVALFPRELALPKEEEPVCHLLPQVVVAPQVAEPAPVVLPATVPVASVEPAASQEWVVQKGESLEKIAKKHRTTVDALLKCNQLSSTFLKVGQKLKIPAPNSSSKSQAPAFTPEGAEYYTMKVGDNPWSIAMKHHLKVEELLKLNGLNEEKARRLKPGDRLRIR